MTKNQQRNCRLALGIIFLVLVPSLSITASGVRDKHFYTMRESWLYANDNKAGGDSSSFSLFSDQSLNFFTHQKQSCLGIFSNGCNNQILYVGGSGSGNYSTIREALSAATHGDTIYVYDDSAPYFEHNLHINKSVQLIGENKRTTVIDGEYKWGLEIITNGVTISGFTFQNCTSIFNVGAMLLCTDNNIITNNTITHCSFGIVLSGGKNNIISNNEFLSNSQGGLYLQKTYNNLIMNNFFSNNKLYGGMVLDNTKRNSVANNHFITDGLFVLGSTQNTIVNNTVNGKPLIYLEGCLDYILEEEVGQVLLVHCLNITVQGHTIANTSAGIVLDNSDQCHICSNSINSNFVSGIYLLNSDDNQIENNTLSENYVGIGVRSSRRNDIISNILHSCANVGVYLFMNSYYNNVDDNSFFYNGMGLHLDSGANNNFVTENHFTSDGVWVYDAWKNQFSNNMINGQPLIYLEETTNKVVNGSAGQVILVSCESITVTNQHISNCTVGMLIVDSKNCNIIQNSLDWNRVYNLFITHSEAISIIGNIIANSTDGILIEYSERNVIKKNYIRSATRYSLRLLQSNYNTISHNSISDNSDVFESLGIFLFNSSDNTIDHNNFLRNNMNAGFMEGFRNKWRGNYWKRPRLLPKLIIGRRWFFIPWINVDWFPAKILNDI